MSEVKKPEIPVPIINYVDLIKNKRSPYYEIVKHLLEEMDISYRKAGVSEVMYTINPRQLQKEIEDKIKSEKLNNVIHIYKGPIFTTSALFAEGKTEVESWHKMGCIAVDMETAATFAVAKYFHMKRLSILFAFDNPRKGSHILLDESEKEHRRNYGESEMIKLALKMAVEYAKTNGR